MLTRKLGILAILLAATAFGQATEPASQPALLQATDKDAILKAVGSTASVTGAVSRTNWYNDSILFVNFKGTKRGDFTVIVKKENRDALDKAFDGDIAKALTGKKITVTGKIAKFRDTPQIEVTKPEQVTIEKSDKPTTSPQ